MHGQCRDGSDGQACERHVDGVDGLQGCLKVLNSGVCVLMDATHPET